VHGGPPPLTEASTHRLSTQDRLTCALGNCIVVAKVIDYNTAMNWDIFHLQADICKCFSHPKRLEILCELKSGERSFGELRIATGLSKANLSQHLAIMRERGAIEARRDGQHLYFSVANPKITQACELMHEVLCERVEAQQKVTGMPE